MSPEPPIDPPRETAVERLRGDGFEDVLLHLARVEVCLAEIPEVHDDEWKLREEAEEKLGDLVGLIERWRDHG